MNWSELADKFNWWTAFGLLGQVFFTGRFLVQWIVSERKGKSVVPIHFWILSLLGSTLLLTYAIGIGDPVFILGQSFGSIVYIRNLMLLNKRKAGGTDD